MVEIKNIVFTSCGFNFIKHLMCFINHLLPLRLKFTNESYVALVDGQKSALVTLDKDSKSHTRFKITKLILEEYCADVSKQLINFVISKYRAQGANSFYVVVDEFQSILVDAKFKSSTEIEFLQHLNGLQKISFVSATPMMDKYLDMLDEFKDLPFYE